MKFVFADSLDYVDPNYDFKADASPDNREPYWDDLFPHEILKQPPYDGVLVSRAIVGDHQNKGKYTDSQAMRFRLVGARKFLRVGADAASDFMVMGDNGAFSYVKNETPPYGVDDTIEFYQDGGFTHGCSIDHIIFEFDKDAVGTKGGAEGSRARYDITQELAADFIETAKKEKVNFTPIGVIQGWSPGSMAEAARNLINMGYEYLAAGGMVPLKTPAIHAALAAIKQEMKSNTKLHVLGFAKADQLHEFTNYGISSFDSTSPLIRAFKDDRNNYYTRDSKGSLKYYTAIRIPQAIQNIRLTRGVKEGRFKQEHLLKLEKRALDTVRAIDRGEEIMDEALEALREYTVFLIDDGKISSESLEKKLDVTTEAYRRTLTDKPWRKCSCHICEKASVEVAIFRASNRNKRRGIHNLSVFYDSLQELRAS